MLHITSAFDYAGIIPPGFNGAAFSYDTASRLQTVSDGTQSATYAYLANSPLVSTVTFK